mmetsp:Transcript_2310/g.3970  ORF Transcript_2310/g.3970 Transcript_2310/m.3970 type:complete len:137 (+) Transcript_2310:108-518(+)
MCRSCPLSYANAHAHAPTARASWCPRHGWWGTTPSTVAIARSQRLRNDDECLQTQLASGVDVLCFARSRRGARKNGRVPNQTMTCHGWDGKPSLLQVLGLTFRNSDPLFFPRGIAVPLMFQDVPRAADAVEIPKKS